VLSLLEVTVQADRSGAVAVAEHPLAHLTAEFDHLGSLGVGGQLSGLVVQGFDLFADGETLVGDLPIGDPGVHEGHPQRSVSKQRGEGFQGHAPVDGLGSQGVPELMGGVTDPGAGRGLWMACSTRDFVMRRPCSMNR